ncbi:MAG: hypothetical protein EBS19_03360 [Spirochaetia bacterium]|nr:hypothetical protein [Spirochaetia bacterium]
MNYFVNVWEISHGQAGSYRTYRLYSGDSVEDIKFRIVNDLKDTWIDVSDEIDDLENLTDRGFREIGHFFSDEIEKSDSVYVYDCHIEISDPYTDVMETVRFYMNHLDDEEEFDDAEVGFYTYGEYANKLEKALPYLSSLCNDYSVSIDDALINRVL